MNKLSDVVVAVWGAFLFTVVVIVPIYVTYHFVSKYW